MMTDYDFDEWLEENYGNVWALQDLMESHGGKSQTAGYVDVNDIEEIENKVWCDYGDEAHNKFMSYIWANPTEIDCDVLEIKDGVLVPFGSFADVINKVKPLIVIDPMGKHQETLDEISCNDCNHCSGAMFCSKQTRNLIKYNKDVYEGL